MKKYLLLMGMGIGLCMQTANAQKTLKVSAVQYPIHGAQSENQFLKRVEGYIISAKKEGASEMRPLGGLPRADRPVRNGQNM
jgi:hypothetical protein